MTPDEVLERTQWDLFWLPSEASWVERPELAYSRSRSDRSFLNCVVRTRLTDEQVPAAIEEVGAAHAGVMSRWMVLDGTRPAAIGERLAQHGYVRGNEHRGTVLPVDRWAEVDTGHTVVRVERRDTLDALYEVVSAAFGRSARPDFDSIEEELAECSPPEGRIHRYVVYDPAGEPVCAGGMTSFPELRFGLLWAGGTVPAARGRGAYRALLQARIHAARRLGLDAVGLYARVGTSWPIVRRLGFETHGRMVYWDRPPR